MNVLFVCTLNRWRSLTAEKIFAHYPGIRVRSAGTAANARVRVNQKLIEWAEIIFVMEPKHAKILKHKFDLDPEHKRLICLDIPDEYQYMDEELIQLLTDAAEPYLPS